MMHAVDKLVRPIDTCDFKKGEFFLVCIYFSLLKSGAKNNQHINFFWRVPARAVPLLSQGFTLVLTSLNVTENDL